MSRRILRAFAIGALALGLAATSPLDEPVRRAGADVPPPPPSQSFDGLFVRVAASGEFADFKSFVDAVPREAPEKILAAYRARMPKSKAALAKFVRRYFALQQPAATPAPQPGLSIEDHIAALWPILTRSTPTVPAYSSALPLPEPYVVPGGRFTEIYYWDSYFTMLGLGARERTLRDGMVDDFAYMIRTYGHVPNGSRTYYLSRSQPPFFFKMVELEGGDALVRYLPEMKAEYAYWMEGEGDVARINAVRNVVAMPDGSILNRYWDERDTPRDEMFPADVAVAKTSREPRNVLYRNIRAAAESGWDFSSRWFADDKTLATIETTNIVPVDLNSLLYGLERAIATGCAETNDHPCVSDFTARAERRRAAMNRYLWDAKAGTFYDYDRVTGARREVLSAATLYPLFVGEADDTQAHAVADIVRAKLLRPGGLATTENHTGEQWDEPNGWAPLQWIAVEGLLRYGQTGPADDIATRWLATVLHAYDTSGRLVEKYDVDDPDRKGGGGEYKLQDGFGWTNGVTVALLHVCRLDGQARHCAAAK
ncbi:MAG TPA: alpha,alpha-trehalase TreF [Rhizomicrobium sp.]|nr:alpha,alpha-trehalase TreF [Rhizomicrobium sp.]